jgi:hypothetical protein
MKGSNLFLVLIIIINLVVLSIFLPTNKVLAEVTATINIDPTEGLVTDENGGTASFTVRLDSAPESNITIDFISSDPSEGTVSPEKIVLNPGNWDKPEQNLFTITGVGDDEDDGDVTYQIIGTASSGDPVPPVSVTNLGDHFPIANDDFPSISGYSPLIIPVLDNDLALFDTPLEISVIDDPSFGTYTVAPNPENTITYTPTENFLGLDQFTYRICDQDNDCADANVIIQDQVPPEIISVSPVGIGEVIEVYHGEVTLEVEPSDNFMVDCVNFFRWDAPNEQFIDLGQDCQAPFQLFLDVKTLNYGWNQVNIVATDYAQNVSSQETLVWFLRVIRTHIPLILSP